MFQLKERKVRATYIEKNNVNPCGTLVVALLSSVRVWLASVLLGTSQCGPFGKGQSDNLQTFMDIWSFLKQDKECDSVSTDIGPPTSKLNKNQSLCVSSPGQHFGFLFGYPLLIFSGKQTKQNLANFGEKWRSGSVGCGYVE